MKQDTLTAVRTPRKSVAFSEGHTVVDANGDITEMNGTSDKTTAESHSTGELIQQEQRNSDTEKQLKTNPSLFTDTAATGDKDVEEVTKMFEGMTKKKKSKKPKDTEQANDGDEATAVVDGELDLAGLKKKKKKKTTKTTDADDFDAKLASAGVDEAAEPAEEEALVDEGDMEKGTGIWQHSSTQPIGYTHLLSRFFTLLHDSHPDLLSGGSRSYKIPPPQCLREGNKKTIFANIPDICKRMKRTDEHVTQFLFAELGTSGSVDGSKRLVIKGRFQQKQIENVLRRYIGMYPIPYFKDLLTLDSRVRHM